MKLVLNVGSNHVTELPTIFNNWKQHTLDIDHLANPDIVCDARELETFKSASYDAVYCSHNLEHYHAHDVPKVLRGFKNILKNEGFVYIKVPDMRQIAKFIADGNDIDDPIYFVGDVPILAKDTIYGWGIVIEQSGQDFFSHKTGFTMESLNKILSANGFNYTVQRTNFFELEVIATKQENALSEIRNFMGIVENGTKTDD